MAEPPEDQRGGGVVVGKYRVRGARIQGGVRSCHKTSAQTWQGRAGSGIGHPAAGMRGVSLSKCPMWRWGGWDSGAVTPDGTPAHAPINGYSTLWRGQEPRGVRVVERRWRTGCWRVPGSGGFLWELKEGNLRETLGLGRLPSFFLWRKGGEGGGVSRHWTDWFD